MKNLVLIACVLLLMPVQAFCSHTITGAEYYFDSDPGEGNGTPLDFKQKGGDIPLILNLKFC